MLRHAAPAIPYASATVADRGTLRGARDRIRSPGTTSVLIGSGLSGLGAYAFQVLGTRSLGDEAYAPIGVLWTIQYLSLTVVLVSVEAYVTRMITLQPDAPGAMRRAVLTLGGWIVAVAALVGAGAWWWREPLFHGAGDDLAILASVIVLSYGVFVLARGQLAGTGRFGAYGAVTGAESMLRFFAALPVAALVSTTRAVAWTLPVGVLAATLWWLAWGRSTRPSRPRHRDEPSPVEASPLPKSPTGRYLVATTVSYGASQTLLAAGPLVLIPLGAGPAEISVFFITITAARVPLVFAFGGLLSRVLPPLTRAARAGQVPKLRRVALAIATAAAATAAAGAGAGAWIGPEVIALFFGAAFTPPGWFVALTVAGVTLATAALGLGQILIAMHRELRLVAPWLAGLAAGAAAVVLLGGDPTLRVASGFVIGEALALAGLLAAVLTVRGQGGEARA